MNQPSSIIRFNTSEPQELGVEVRFLPQSHQNICERCYRYSWKDDSVHNVYEAMWDSTQLYLLILGSNRYTRPRSNNLKRTCDRQHKHIWQNQWHKPETGNGLDMLTPIMSGTKNGVYHFIRFNPVHMLLISLDRGFELAVYQGKIEPLISPIRCRMKLYFPSIPSFFWFIWVMVSTHPRLETVISSSYIILNIFRKKTTNYKARPPNEFKESSPGTLLDSTEPIHSGKLTYTIENNHV